MNYWKLKKDSKYFKESDIIKSNWDDTVFYNLNNSIIDSYNVDDLNGQEIMKIDKKEIDG